MAQGPTEIAIISVSDRDAVFKKCKTSPEGATADDDSPYNDVKWVT